MIKHKHCTTIHLCRGDVGIGRIKPTFKKWKQGRREVIFQNLKSPMDIDDLVPEENTHPVECILVADNKDSIDVLIRALIWVRDYRPSIYSGVTI